MPKLNVSTRLSSVAIAMAALCTLPVATHAQAQAAPLAASQSSYHRMLVGSVEVIALSDGTVPVPAAYLISNSPNEVTRLLNKAFLPQTVDTSVNAYLIKTGGKRILVDAGTAELFGPSLNKLPAALARVGVTPDQITDILVTHIHTDHTGGFMQGSNRAFPNAKVHLEKAERDYWLSPANKAAARADQKNFFDEAVLKFKPYDDAGQVVTFQGATQIFPGIKSQPAPGHTPGHSMYWLEDGGEKLLFWGDVVHVGAVQFPNPTVTIVFDVDPDAARAQRKQAFADAALNGYMVAAPHLPFPGIGHVTRVAPPVGAFQGSDRLYKEIGEYRFYPMPYVNNAPYPN